MKNFLFLLFLIQLFFAPLNAQVVIGTDPSEVSAEKEQSQSTVVSPSGEKKITLTKEDREKILAIFKKIYPDKSVQALNYSLNKHLVDGSIVLNPKENKELEDFLATGPDRGLFDKIQDYAMGGNANTVFAVVDDLRAAFAENPLSVVPKAQVKETLLKQWEGKTLGNLLKNNPRLLEFFAALITDRVAVGKLLDIFQKRSELKYFIVLVVLAQIMCVLAFFALFKQSTIVGRIFKRTLLMFGVNAILLLYFVWRFYPEVSPTITIFHQSFF